MIEKSSKTYIIFTADDFGRSQTINQAVVQAHSEGILKCASLMVTGNAFEDAVRIAKEHPSLQVGLHLAITDVFPASKVSSPYLLTKQGHFKNSPAEVGLALQFSRQAEKEIEREVTAQFEAYAQTGLPFRHVDCHHHLHIHPKLFDMILKNAHLYGIQTVRIPYEPWEISGQISKGHAIRNWFYRQVFGSLSSRCKKKAAEVKISFCDAVFGLYRTGELTEEWTISLIKLLENKAGIFEIYTHPDLYGQGANEWKSLLSNNVANALQTRKISCIGYREMVEIFSSNFKNQE